MSSVLRRGHKKGVANREIYGGFSLVHGNWEHNVIVAFIHM
jgi:hypothetical protein